MAKISMLTENGPLMIIFNLVGLGSLVVYVVLLVKTRIKVKEFLRDWLMVGSMACVALIFLSITSFVTVFEYRTPLFVLFILASLCVLGAFVYMVRDAGKLGTEWLATFIGGVAWAVGVAFYLYMALASMSNPPLNWGYPRTVQGFFHAFTRGQYERIHPTTEPGRYIEQLQMYAGGLLDEFNLVYLLIGIIPFFFYKKLQAWKKP